MIGQMESVKVRNNYLFVIGIDKYQNNQHPNLVNSVYDCNNLIDVLRDKYSFKLIVEPLYDELATRRNIINELGQLSLLIREEDNLIIYFAGHGSINPNTKKGYWIPVDADYSESDYIPNSTIKDKLEDINAKHIFLIADSCFSGTFLTRTRSPYDETKHYIKLDNSKSRLYLSSGREERVSDGKEGKGSPFSKSILKILKDNTEKFMSALEFINMVTKATGAVSNQQPLGGYIDDTENEWGQMVFIKTIVDDYSITNDEFNILMRVSGFYFGQTYSVEKINVLYPSLKISILIARLKWDSVFSDSISSINAQLKFLLKEEWDDAYDKYKELVKGHIDSQTISFEDATVFIQEIELRSKGHMPYPIAGALINNIPAIRDRPVLEYIRNFKQKISSKETPKAKGLNFDIEYPMSWSFQEGKRPNVLWLTKSQYGNIVSTSTVHLVSKMAEIDESDLLAISSEEVANNIFTLESLQSQTLSHSPSNIDYKRITIDGCHAARIEYDGHNVGVVGTIDFFQRSYFILYKNYLLTINFQIVQDKMLFEKNEYNFFFDLIMSSLVVMSKYEQ